LVIAVWAACMHAQAREPKSLLALAADLPCLAVEYDSVIEAYATYPSSFTALWARYRVTAEYVALVIEWEDPSWNSGPSPFPVYPVDMVICAGKNGLLIKLPQAPEADRYPGTLIRPTRGIVAGQYPLAQMASALPEHREESIAIDDLRMLYGLIPGGSLCTPELPVFPGRPGPTRVAKICVDDQDRLHSVNIGFGAGEKWKDTTYHYQRNPALGRDVLVAAEARLAPETMPAEYRQPGGTISVTDTTHHRGGRKIRLDFEAEPTLGHTPALAQYTVHHVGTGERKRQANIHNLRAVDPVSEEDTIAEFLATAKRSPVEEEQFQLLTEHFLKPIAEVPEADIARLRVIVEELARSVAASTRPAIRLRLLGKLTFAHIMLDQTDQALARFQDMLALMLESQTHRARLYSGEEYIAVLRRWHKQAAADEACRVWLDTVLPTTPPEAILEFAERGKFWTIVQVLDRIDWSLFKPGSDTFALKAARANALHTLDTMDDGYHANAQLWGTIPEGYKAANQILLKDRTNLEVDDALGYYANIEHPSARDVASRDNLMNIRGARAAK